MMKMINNLDNSFKIMGVDQSMHATGVCIIDQRSSIIESYNIKNMFKEMNVKPINLTENLNIQMKILNRTIKRYEPLLIVREGYSYGSARMQNSSSIFELGEVGGAVNQICYINGYRLDNNKYYIIPPTKHKKFNLNQSNIKKDSKYLLTIFKKFNIEFNTDDEADAFMLANLICCLENLKRHIIQFEDLKNYQIEALLDDNKTNKKYNKILENNITFNKILKMDKIERIKFLL